MKTIYWCVLGVACLMGCDSSEPSTPFFQEPAAFREPQQAEPLQRLPMVASAPAAPRPLPHAPGPVRPIAFHQSLPLAAAAVGAGTVPTLQLVTPDRTIDLTEGEAATSLNLATVEVRVLANGGENLTTTNVRLSINNGTAMRPATNGVSGGQSHVSFPGLHLQGQMTFRVQYLDSAGAVATVHSYAVDSFAGPLEVTPRVDQLKYDQLVLDFNSKLFTPANNKTFREFFLLEELSAQVMVDPSKKADASDLLPNGEVSRNGRTLIFNPLTLVAGKRYRLYAKTAALGVADVYGNQLVPSPGEQLLHLADFSKPEPDDEGPVANVRGIQGPGGPYVAYPEFTPPRHQPDGFNPNDKVETRVARLYYYRDAHRVAQIINRKVRSYNIAGVEMSRQQADKARGRADEARLERQRLERDAVQKAKETREKEAQLQQAQQDLNSAVRELANSQSLANQPDPDPAAGAGTGTGTGTGSAAAKGVSQQLEGVVASLSSRVDQLRDQVENARAQEVAANEQSLQAAAREELAAQEQFRREVAAAKADPNTYAAGVPQSMDPVEQVSVSVIGEGLIHLRGPLKGINIIRQMIDRIDTPVGQVRVQVHTVNIGGEHGDRMEKAATKAELHIEQARFLTMQSSEMLRRAVVQVASRKAEEARALHPGTRQSDRDFRYLNAFFGQDFINELESIDSEFLRTGNKLLSLHSMDTTSLSSALTLMSLAKNSTRQEIMQQFEELLIGELPPAEQRFLEPRLTSCRRCRRCICRHRNPNVCLLAGNASFQSLRGFFSAEVAHDETMAPMQREFIRLAQIFKSRLITELEYKQRIMERALIEERINTHYEQRRQDAFYKERDAEKQVGAARETRINKLGEIRKSFVQLNAAIDQINSKATSGVKALEHFQQWAKDAKAKYRTGQPFRLTLEGGRQLHVVSDQANGDYMTPVAGNGRRMLDELERVTRILKRIHSDTLSQYKYTTDLATYLRLKRILENLPFDQAAKKLTFAQSVPGDQILLLVEALEKTLLLNGKARGVALELRSETEALSLMLHDPDSDAQVAYRRWRELRDLIMRFIWQDQTSELMTSTGGILKKVETNVVGFLDASVKVDVAQELAEFARRPLDQKKFLDMLVDDLEEKYIELLEGTRAHTANIDNYIKRLTTALDDDFNNQFYEPAFKQVRAAGRMWDVQFGQIETTGILANNRSFAKVTPRATMEFDLPERKLLLSEGIGGAKAIFDDVGALVNDSSFLAMTKFAGPRSGAMPTGGDSQGLGLVRNVLPGLESSSVSEEVMSQAHGGANQVGSNLENLIPDPAIYKFETGTGYEIRPVIQPDGQAVVFDFNYMYTTEVREPVRADEKHLGRVKRHFIDTDVQLSNFELRKVSRYQVALKASRTARGVPLLEDVPLIGILFRPMPQQESSLQQNIILAQATIFPTLFDLMGLRWAPAVADLDPLRLSNEEFVVRQRQRHLRNRVYDATSSKVDEFLRIPDDVRRPDLYRTQETLPRIHPNGYRGDGLDYQESMLEEGYHLEQGHEGPKFIPGASREGSPLLPHRRFNSMEGYPDSQYPLEMIEPGNSDPGVEIESSPIGPPSTITPAAYSPRRGQQGAARQAYATAPQPAARQDYGAARQPTMRSSLPPAAQSSRASSPVTAPAFVQSGQRGQQARRASSPTTVQLLANPSAPQVRYQPPRGAGDQPPAGQQAPRQPAGSSSRIPAVRYQQPGQPVVPTSYASPAARSPLATQPRTAAPPHAAAQPAAHWQPPAYPTTSPSRYGAPARFEPPSNPTPARGYPGQPSR